MRQFYSQFVFASNSCSVLAMDYVGHGQSEVSSKDHDYTTESILEDVKCILGNFEDRHKDIILVCHSYGCSIGSKLAINLQNDNRFKVHGIILIAPKSKLSVHDLKIRKTLFSTPNIIFDLFRIYDRWGGIYSASVNRIVAKGASEHVRRIQLETNRTTSTSVIKATASGVIMNVTLGDFHISRRMGMSQTQQSVPCRG